jgi:hypothetical protein
MTEHEADQEATRRNFELGSQRRTDKFWIPVQRGDGQWDVELRQELREKRSRLSSLIDAILSMPWP